MKTKITFIPNERTFYNEKESLVLSPHFKKAEESIIKVDNGKKGNERYCLKLFYDTYKIYQQSANITRFLSNAGLLGKLEVKSGKELDSIYITGEKGILKLNTPKKY